MGAKLITGCAGEVVVLARALSADMEMQMHVILMLFGVTAT